MNWSSSSQPATTMPDGPPSHTISALTTRKPTIVSLYQAGALPRKFLAIARASVIVVARPMRPGSCRGARGSACERRHLDPPPHSLSAADLVDRRERALVRDQLLDASAHDPQYACWPGQRRERFEHDVDPRLGRLAQDQ